MTPPLRTIVGVGEVFTDGDPDAEPLLLLHPWFGCWRFWRPTMQLLPDRWCVAPDFYSLSNGVWDGLATPQGLMTAVLASMDELGLDTVDLVGNSVGGIVAQLMAIEHPERVRRLVLVGTGPYTKAMQPLLAAEVANWVDDPEAAHRAGAARAVAVVTQSELEPEDFDACVDAVESADPHFVAAVLRSARALDLRSELHRITAPTLVVRGSFDPIRTPEHSVALLEGIADSRDFEMEGAGHAPYVDDPKTFVSELRRFLDAEVTPGGGYLAH
jgi:pimeloyl-ACP methyl ester carboxylesterase